MKRIYLAVAFFGIVLLGSAQDTENYGDSTNLVSGSLNISVHLGRNAGANTNIGSGLVSPGVMVGNVYLGYQYKVSEVWGVNTSLGIGYQSFKFRTEDEISKDVFNEITFMMPYFGLEIELKRTLANDFFFGLSANLHVNTLAAYDAEYNEVNAQITSFDQLSLERNRTEYAGVQHGAGFTIGKQITTGTWSGIDLFAHALLLNRQKLVVDYWVDGKSIDETPTGKFRYNGGFIGVGICYNFKG